MDKDIRRIAFLKALIAAAWADGELSSGEITTLTYYLQLLLISTEEYESLKPLLEKAISPDQARALVKEQLELLQTPEERRTLVAAVEDLLVSDDKLEPGEAAFLSELRNLTRHVPTAQVFISRLKALWETVPRPSPGQRPRSGLVDRFLQRRMLEYFRQRIALSRARQGLSLEEEVTDLDLYRAVIWAGLLHRVAQADNSLCPAEQEQLLQVLSTFGDVPRPDLEVVADAFADGSLAAIDLGVLVKEFNQLASSDDDSTLLDCLFLVAAADGNLQQAEVSVIHRIATGAGFSEQAFRSSLSRCRQRLQAGWN